MITLRYSKNLLINATKCSACLMLPGTASVDDERARVGKQYDNETKQKPLPLTLKTQTCIHRYTRHITHYLHHINTYTETDRESITETRSRQFSPCLKTRAIARVFAHTRAKSFSMNEKSPRFDITSDRAIAHANYKLRCRNYYTSDCHLLLS